MRDTRKTRPAIWICGGEEHLGFRDCPLDKRGADCPNAADHAPMPEAYGAWHAVATMRTKARQSSKRCPGCGLYRIATGGRDVPGWPRTLADVPS